jgi:hypothetical protein
MREANFGHLAYILNKFETSESVLNKLRKFKIIGEVCDVDEKTIEKGLNSNLKIL